MTSTATLDDDDRTHLRNLTAPGRVREAPQDYPPYLSVSVNS
ncbi:hypothetical protein AB0H00_09140 [Nocardia sp. NPDC023852]